MSEYILDTPTFKNRLEKEVDVYNINRNEAFLKLKALRTAILDALSGESSVHLSVDAFTADQDVINLTDRLTKIFPRALDSVEFTPNGPVPDTPFTQGLSRFPGLLRKHVKSFVSQGWVESELKSHRIKILDKSIVRAVLHNMNNAKIDKQLVLVVTNVNAPNNSLICLVKDTGNIPQPLLDCLHFFDGR